VTKTCLQCGAVLPSNVRICSFCESSLPANSGDAAWRSELSQRLASYRARRRRTTPSDDQSEFLFETQVAPAAIATDVADTVVDPDTQPSAISDDFSFTIAIGRTAPSRQSSDAQMFIDVSLPASSTTADANVQGSIEPPLEEKRGLFPVASMDDRRIAALVDGACLLFAYGGFLALFGSLGGQFTFSKMSAAVYSIAFAIVYLQYFLLFTVFGGTTPGMMLRGLQVVDFSGQTPSPRKLLLRATGYILSAGTFFLGFLWAMWDEDELTWHDRISQTYLSSAERIGESEINGALHGHS